MHTRYRASIKHEPVRLLEDIHITRALGVMIAFYRGSGAGEVALRGGTGDGATYARFFGQLSRDGLRHDLPVQAFLVNDLRVQVEIGAEKVFDQLVMLIFFLRSN